MFDSRFDAICQYAKTLNIEAFTAGLAQFSHDNNLSEESLIAVEGVFRHMAHLKNEAVVNTLLRTSRLPLKNPKTFENFDFSRLHGKNIGMFHRFRDFSRIKRKLGSPRFVINFSIISKI